MKIRETLCLLAVLVLLFGSTSCSKKGATVDNGEVAEIDTNYGKIVIQFFPEAAPRHVENFKELAREGFYEGTKFHRLVKIQGKLVAIQGGDPNTISGEPSTWGQGQPGQKTVPAEFSRTLKHERGIVSAARRTESVDSASSQFFICTASNPAWDGQYSIFGKVIEGMNVVDSIANAPVFQGTGMPTDPVVINKIILVKK